ncbi:MAG: hypothetical protein K2N47_05535, partial [Clostridia bacterium]|nr:hypothetical protein [Clostridia bacterium]
MENENRIKITDNPQLFIKTVSVFASVIMVIFEIIICASFLVGGAQPAWMIAMLIVCSVALDVLFIVEIYCVKTIKARIIMYAFDLGLLIAICAITGSVYLCALFCVILTQFYINVDDIKPKIIVVIASCVIFVVTCIVGWLIREPAEQNKLNGLLEIIYGNVIGLLALVVHFLVTNFLISFYRTNVKLT